MIITPFQVAQTFVGIKEFSGAQDNPLILAMLQTCPTPAVLNDEVAWCSAFVNFIAKMLKLPRSHSLAAKSWLEVGYPLYIGDGIVDSDIVVFNRGTNPALGHVGFFAGTSPGVSGASFKVHILGGNQGNSVSLQDFPVSDIAGIRRLI